MSGSVSGFCAGSSTWHIGSSSSVESRILSSSDSTFVSTASKLSPFFASSAQSFASSWGVVLVAFISEFVSVLLPAFALLRLVLVDLADMFV